ncbi:hypothetical protein OV450_3907 [Actinobacteria bacterium OV450]|nr:hypothetical protein OV450_3907 [Actinobacteria bacterium OV450]
MSLPDQQTPQHRSTDQPHQATPPTHADARRNTQAREQNDATEPHRHAPPPRPTRDGRGDRRHDSQPCAAQRTA